MSDLENKTTAQLVQEAEQLFGLIMRHPCIAELISRSEERDEAKRILFEDFEHVAGESLVETASVAASSFRFAKHRADSLEAAHRETTARYPTEAEKIAACPTPEYHKTHRYCPSCPWQEPQDTPEAGTPSGSANVIADIAQALATRAENAEALVAELRKELAELAADRSEILRRAYVENNGWAPR